MVGLAAEVMELENYLRCLARGDEALQGGVNARATPAYALYRFVSSSSSWPLPRAFGVPTFVSLVSPFFGAFGISASTILDFHFQLLETLH